MLAAWMLFFCGAGALVASALQVADQSYTADDLMWFAIGFAGVGPFITGAVLVAAEKR